MAFALANVVVYAVPSYLPLRNKLVQVCTFTLTALASDTAANLKTIAEADSTDGGKALAAVLQRADKIVSVFSDVSARTTAAAGASHSLDASTATAPVLTFTGTASTPLTQTISLVVSLKNDAQAVSTGV